MHACILDCGVVYEHVQSSILLCFKVTNITYKDTPLENTRIHVQNVRRRYVRIDIGVGTRGGGGGLSPSMIVHGGTVPHTGTGLPIRMIT